MLRSWTYIDSRILTQQFWVSEQIGMVFGDEISQYHVPVSVILIRYGAGWKGQYYEKLEHN